EQAVMEMTSIESKKVILMGAKLSKCLIPETYRSVPWKIIQVLALPDHGGSGRRITQPFRERAAEGNAEHPVHRQLVAERAGCIVQAFRIEPAAIQHTAHTSRSPRPHEHAERETTHDRSGPERHTPYR